MIDLTGQSGAALFGVATALTATEADRLAQTLNGLWQTTYGDLPGPLDADLRVCRTLFDPTNRGQTLRDRLSRLPGLDASMYQSAIRLGEPLVIDAGHGRAVVGPEARVLLYLLAAKRPANGGGIVLSVTDVLTAERAVLTIYRNWSMRRLKEVIALRDGRGAEVLQARSVGLVLALLINRATSAERAIARPGTAFEQQHPVDEALHEAAAVFAETITTTRRRAAAENRLHGGYPFTEARRRLADRLVLTGSGPGRPGSVYIRPEATGDVVAFLGADLARRDGLTTQTLVHGFDQLVATFRAHAQKLATGGRIYERPADTAALRGQLLEAFTAARG